LRTNQTEKGSQMKMSQLRTILAQKGSLWKILGLKKNLAQKENLTNSLILRHQFQINHRKKGLDLFSIDKLLDDVFI
jgi:hypothetical protein